MAKKRPKRTPPNNVNFSDRDDYLAREDMSDGAVQMFRFLRTFDNMADGNNPQEFEYNPITNTFKAKAVSGLIGGVR